MLHPFAKPFAIQNPSAPEIHRSVAPKGPPGRERRGRPRVLLELPVRVRWLGPFGLETEITQTRNASRDGVLVRGVAVERHGVRDFVRHLVDASFERQLAPTGLAALGDISL